MHGVFNVLKPPGMTSHDVVSIIRRATKIKRVGHTGTLDPAAAGVLPICIGQATRLAEYLQSGTKEYIAEATFGYETDSCDAVGKTVQESDAGFLTLEKLREVLDPFRGPITQTPPLHSAIKVGGKKLYELAREDDSAEKENIVIPIREVVVSKLHVTQFFRSDARPRAMLHIECSGGTYIRSLVRDIGRAFGCGATMTFLVRTRSGAFDQSRASTLEEVCAAPEGVLIPFSDALRLCAAEYLESDEAMALFAQGKKTELPEVKAESIVAIANSEKTAAAIASRQADGVTFKPDKVFFLDS